MEYIAHKKKKHQARTFHLQSCALAAFHVQRLSGEDTESRQPFWKELFAMTTALSKALHIIPTIFLPACWDHMPFRVCRRVSLLSGMSLETRNACRGCWRCPKECTEPSTASFLRPKLKSQLDRSQHSGLPLSYDRCNGKTLKGWGKRR